MATIISTSPARLYLGGKLIGTCHTPFTPLPEATPTEREINTSFSASFTMNLSKGRAKALKELVNPSLKAWHHWVRVKQAQQRRHLARRRQGRS